MKPYFISGHGHELDSTMTIPDNCIVIVKTHSGEIAYRTHFDKICRLPLHVLQNPLENMHTIIKTFGTVAVYTARQKCPDFMYTLNACYNEPISACETYGSGILDLERIVGDEEICHTYVPEKFDFFKNLDEHLSYDEIIDKIAYKYRNSVNPTESYIREVLDSVEAREEIMSLVVDPEHITLIDKFNLCISYLIRHKHLARKQSELTGPAVYYNFLCREKPGASPLYGKLKRTTYRTPFLPPKTFGIHDKSIKTAITKNLIAEAEFHRKRALRNYFSEESKLQARKRSSKRSSTRKRSKSTGKFSK